MPDFRKPSDDDRMGEILARRLANNVTSDRLADLERRLNALQQPESPLLESLAEVLPQLQQPTAPADGEPIVTPATLNMPGVVDEYQPGKRTNDDSIIPRN